MNKILLGAVIGAGLLLGTHAFAYTITNTLTMVENLNVGSQQVTKYQDSANGVACYVLVDKGDGVGISCVK